MAVCVPCAGAALSTTSASTGLAGVVAGIFGYKKLSSKKKSKTKSSKKKKSKTTSSTKKKKQSGGSGYETQEEYDQMNQMEDYSELQSKCNHYLSEGFKNLLEKNIPEIDLKKYAKESFKIKVNCEKNKFTCNDCEEFLEMTKKLKKLPPPVPDKVRSKDIMKKGRKLSEKNRFLLQSTINRMEVKRLRNKKRSSKLSRKLSESRRKSKKLSKLRKTRSAPVGGKGKRTKKRSKRR